MAIRLSPKKIAQTIVESFDYKSPPRKLITLVESLLVLEGFDEVSAFETASDMLNCITDEISQIVTKNRNNSIVSACELVGDNYTILVGSGYKRPIDCEEILTFRETIPFLNNIWESLCLLEPNHFEIFCSKLLQTLGATVAITTKQTGDEGIDFLAKLHFPNSFENIGIESIDRSFYVNVFGQAKRYSKNKKVGTGEIRELIGSLSVLRYQEVIGASNSLNNIKNQFGEIKLCDPMVCLFVTTGQFSIDAIQLSQKTGVITKDGKQLATYIAGQKIGFEDKNGSLEFNPKKFFNWVLS